MIPQIEKPEIVNHLKIEGEPRKTIDNQWQKENWSSNLLDTCQKESAQKIDQ